MTIKEEQYSKEVGRMHKKLIKLREHAEILRQSVIKKRRALNLYCWRMKLLKQYDEELYHRIRDETDKKFPRIKDDLLV